MLVLSRKVNQTILIDNGIKITILGAQGRLCQIGIEAPSNIKIVRGELLERLQNDDPKGGSDDQAA